MSDSITFDNGLTMIHVDNLDVLSEPSQELANAIATGPQDEFFQLLENTNGNIRRIIGGRNYYNQPTDNSFDVSVTPSWNWRPGTYDKIRAIVTKILQLEKRSSGVYKFIKRTKDSAEWNMHNLLRNFDELEGLKHTLKSNNYPFNVDIEEYTDKLKSFSTSVIEQCEKVEETFQNISIKPYIYINHNNTRNSMFYLDITLNELKMNIFHQSNKIQEIALEPIRIVVSNKLRDSMGNYLKTSRRNNYSFKGIYQAPEYESMHTNNGNRCFSFPYISKPRYSYNNSRYEYQAVCLDKYLDDIRNNLSKVEYMPMIMNFMSWATYYNTEYSNPYNQPYELHFGMPEYMNKEYRAAFPISADNCSGRLGNLYGLNSYPSISSQYLNNGIDMINDECDRIQCAWRGNCRKYSQIKHNIGLIDNEDLRHKAESLLGFIKSLDDWTVIFSDYYEIASDEDDILLNHLIINYSYGDNISGNQILSDFGYFDNEDGGELEDRDGEGSVPTREQIQERMLQWATERSM